MSPGFHIKNGILEYKDLKSQLDQMQAKDNWIRELKDFLADWTKDQATYIVPTSGSTGKPKRISVYREDLIRSARITNEFLGLKTGMTALMCLPVKYIAGKLMLIRSMEANMECELVRPSSNPFLKLEKKIDFVAITPHQLHHILKDGHSKKKLAEVGTIIIGGGHTPAKDLEEIRQFRSKTYLTYGMTETLTHIAMSEQNDRSDSIEYRLISNDFTIEADSNDRLCIRSPYRHMKTILTNDVVQLTGSDRFILKGRIDNVINSGGIKIFPEEIEKRLSPSMTAPFFVAGISDEGLGQKLILVIESKNTDEAWLHDMRLTMEGCIADPFMRPKEIHLLPEFEYTGNGKIQRAKTIKKLRDGEAST